MAEDKRGWWRHPREHALAAKGIKTSTTEKPEPRTKLSTPEVNPKQEGNNKQKEIELRQGFDKERERLLKLFADRNYRYELQRK